MAFSYSSPVLTITGTETVADAFADSFNSPSGDTGTYIDRFVIDGDTDYIVYKIKANCRLSISGTFTIFNSTVVFEGTASNPEITINNGGVLTVGNSSSSNSNSKESKLITLRPFNFTWTSGASIIVGFGGRLNIYGSSLCLSSLLFFDSNSTFRYTNGEVQTLPTTAGYNQLYISSTTIQGTNLVFSQSPLSGSGADVVISQPISNFKSTLGVQVQSSSSTGYVLNKVDFPGGYMESADTVIFLDFEGNYSTFFNSSFMYLEGGTKEGRAIFRFSFTPSTVNSVGSPLENARIYLIDTDNGNRDVLDASDITLTDVSNSSGLFPNITSITSGIIRQVEDTEASRDSRLPINGVIHKYGYESALILNIDVIAPFNQKYFHSTDVFITETTQATVAGYTTGQTTFSADKLYDYASHDKENAVNIVYPTLGTRWATAVGLTCKLNTDYTLSIDSSNAGISVNHSTQVIEIPPLAAGTTFSNLEVSSLVLADTTTQTVSVKVLDSLEVAGDTNLAAWEFEDCTITTSAGSAVVTVADSQINNVTAGTNVTIVEVQPIITLTGFPNNSNITVSQAGRTLEAVFNQNSPYNYQTLTGQSPTYLITVAADGYKTSTLEITPGGVNQSVPVALAIQGSSDTYSAELDEFIKLMLVDSGFIRIYTDAVTEEVDRAHLIPTQQWLNEDWQIVWNNVVTEIANSPTTLEINAWIAHIADSGIVGIAFNEETGEVS